MGRVLQRDRVGIAEQGRFHRNQAIAKRGTLTIDLSIRALRETSAQPRGRRRGQVKDTGNGDGIHSVSPGTSRKTVIDLGTERSGTSGLMRASQGDQAIAVLRPVVSATQKRLLTEVGTQHDPAGAMANQGDPTGGGIRA